MSKPAGSRLRSLRILCTRCRVPRYQPVEDAAVYSVVVPSYLVNGGDGYTAIGDEMVKHSSGETPGGGSCWSPGGEASWASPPSPGDLDVSVVSQFIEQRGLVFPALEGRISVLGAASGLGPPARVLLGALVVLGALVLRGTT